MNKTYTVLSQCFASDPITVDVFASRIAAHEYRLSLRRCGYVRADVFCNGVLNTVPSLV